MARMATVRNFGAHGLFAIEKSSVYEEGKPMLALSLFRRCAVAVLAVLALAAVAPAGAAALGPAVRAHDLTAGPDGNIWFIGGAPFSDSLEVVGRVTPTGEVMEFPLGAGDRATPSRPSIVSGPDGNLWFAEGRASKVGRVDPAGTVTEFSVPARSRATGIAAGSDGALWFTIELADRIGRIATDGTVTEYPLPSGRRPAGIVAGPDGALWFAERGAGQIGRITTDGALSEYPLPESAQPSAIVVGVDGNLWFSDAAASRIGRMTVAGRVVWFGVPGRGGLGPLAAAPDGKIWFARGTALWSISPNGTLSRPWCLHRNCRLPALSLAMGPEGDLWFGGGTPLTEGGGGTAIGALHEKGRVARAPFIDPPLDLEIGGAARVPGGRRVHIALSCDGALTETSCAGVLRLTKRIRLRPGGPRRKVLLARGAYDLAVGDRERIALRLTLRAKKLLRARRSIAVAAKAIVDGRVQTRGWPIRLLKAPVPTRR
jgi:virginiamycin B lyase